MKQGGKGTFVKANCKGGGEKVESERRRIEGCVKSREEGIMKTNERAGRRKESNEEKGKGEGGIGMGIRGGGKEEGRSRKDRNGEKGEKKRGRKEKCGGREKRGREEGGQ